MAKLSPKPLQGMMMGMWFLACAYGQYVAGVILIIIAPLVRKLMQEVK